MLYLCDTCILIDYLRGKTEVKQKLEKDREQGLGMSSVTYMELMVGALNKREVGIIKKAFVGRQADLTEFSTKTREKWPHKKAIFLGKGDIDNILRLLQGGI